MPFCPFIDALTGCRFCDSEFDCGEDIGFAFRLIAVLEGDLSELCYSKQIGSGGDQAGIGPRLIFTPSR